MNASRITKAQLKALTEKTMREHGLHGWKVRIGSAVRQLGSCNSGTRTITISHPMAEANPMAEVMDTILHEIAHALAGPGAGHGPAWRSMARTIGAKPNRVASSSTVAPPKTLRGVCPNCSKTYLRHRRTTGAACSPCCRRYNGGHHSTDFVLVWERV